MIPCKHRMGLRKKLKSASGKWIRRKSISGLFCLYRSSSLGWIKSHTKGKA